MAMADECDVGWQSTKGSNILLEPMESSDNVEEAIIAANHSIYLGGEEPCKKA